MNLLQIPRCALGLHHRDAKKVIRNDTGQFTSVCSGCGVPMWRYMDGWTTVRRDPVEVTTAANDGSPLPTRSPNARSPDARSPNAQSPNASPARHR